jgi:beta-galactosidase
MQVYDNGFVELMDVVGQNYRENELVAAWQSKPDRKVIGTENRHDNQTWLILRDNPFMSGQFLWTGIDYLGEASWPEISWGAALLDRNGYMKPTGYERQSWWSEKPMVKIVRSEDNAGKGQLKMDWTPADFGTYDEAYIYVYSNCEEVELFLNDESKGRLPINTDASPRFWNIGFDAGTIKAIGYNKEKEVAVDEMKTAETPAKILLTAERTKVKNTWEDLVYVKATVVDKNGVHNPNLNLPVTFTVSGSGFIKAVDNGNILSHEKYKANIRTTSNGNALALIQASADNGNITVTATAEGLEGSTITLKATPADQ